jgi:hypothetical protein
MLSRSWSQRKPAAHPTAARLAKAQANLRVQTSAGGSHIARRNGQRDDGAAAAGGRPCHRTSSYFPILLLCQHETDDRPSMWEIVRELELILRMMPEEDLILLEHLGVLLAYSLLLESKLRWVQVLLALNGLFVVVVPLV